MGIRGGSLEEAGVLEDEKELVLRTGERDVPGGGDRACTDTEVLKGWWVWRRREESCVTRVQVGRECEGKRRWGQAGPICQPATALLCLSGKAIRIWCSPDSLPA